MNNSLCVSIMTKKGVSAVTLMVGGTLVKKSVTKIKDEDVLSSSYMCLIHTFIVALRLVKNYIENNADIENVVFEVNNSTFIKWVYNNYSKDQYQGLFMQALDLLNKIPMRYTFTYSQKPFATRYVFDSVDEVKVSGLLDN